MTDSSRAIWAKIGYPSNVGDVITILSPGLVIALSTCMMTPVAPTPMTTCSSRTPTCPAIKNASRSGKTPGSGWPSRSLDQRGPYRRQRRERILVERQRQWVPRRGQSADSGVRHVAPEGGHQPRPPHRTAAAPAKSPACANAAIITTSPFFSCPSEIARSRFTGMPAANRLPQSSNVSTCRYLPVPAPHASSVGTPYSADW